LDNGNIVEFDHPFLLLVKDPMDNDFTNEEGIFASMILETG